MYATLLLPDFRLQAALRFTPAPWRTEPVALLASGEGRNAVLEVSAPALQQGARAGMSPAQALARCPALKFVAPCQESERNTRDALLQVAWSLSPKVEAKDPGICTADLRGCYGKPKRLLAEALRRLAELQLQAKAGLASSPELALLAAHQGNPLLCVENGAAFAASLSLTALTRDRILLETLSRWGVHTADALLQLPRQQTLERLGPAGRALWEAARGGGGRPLLHAQEPLLFEESLDFEQELETLEPLLFVLNRLLEALLYRIKCSGRVISGLELKLLLENHSAYQRSFTVPSPTLDPAVLLGILQTHLEPLHLEHRAIGVRLRLETTLEKTCTQDLFEPALRAPNQFGETLARLCALLGEDRVGIPLASLSHFSEDVRLGAPSVLYRESAGPLPLPSLPKRGLPLHRLRPAQAARVDFTGSQPVFINSPNVSGKITASRGPYRFSAHWWDGEGRTHEEWDIFVTLREGTRRGSALARIGTALISHCSAERREPEWRLEGIYNIQHETG